MLGRPWGPMSGNLYSDRSQNTYKTCRTQGFLYGEQRSTMAGNACLSEDMLDVRDLGNFACHCTHSFTKQKKALFSTSFIRILGPVWRQVFRHRPPVPTLSANRSQDTYETCRTQGFLFCLVHRRVQWQENFACLNMCWMCVMMVGGNFW